MISIFLSCFLLIALAINLFLSPNIALGLQLSQTIPEIPSFGGKIFWGKSKQNALFRTKNTKAYGSDEHIHGHLKLWDMNNVDVDSIETFIVSKFPPNRLKYWDFITQERVNIGVQFEPTGNFPEYHLGVGDTHTTNLDESIRLLTQHEQDGIIYREYTLQSKQDIPRPYHHFYVQWPDLDIPNQERYFRFLDSYTKLLTGSDMKVHVHCKAGLGRSGTFVLTRALITQQGNPEVFTEVLQNMRKQRAGLVETSAQEEFAKMAAIEYSSHHQQQQQHQQQQSLRHATAHTILTAKKAQIL